MASLIEPSRVWKRGALLNNDGVKTLVTYWKIMPK